MTDERVDRISLKMALTTLPWLMVWAGEPDRLIDVRMTYNELKTIYDLFYQKRVAREWSCENESNA